MKRSTFHVRKSPELPIAWREAKYSGLRAKSADKYDACLSEDIFDAEDERAEIDNIIHGMLHEAN